MLKDSKLLVETNASKDISKINLKTNNESVTNYLYLLIKIKLIKRSIRLCFTDYYLNLEQWNLYK